MKNGQNAATKTTLNLRRGAESFSRFHELSLQHSVPNCGRTILQIIFQVQPTKGVTNLWQLIVCLIQFTDQGIRNIKDTVKRGDAAMAEAEKMGMKIVDEFWTMGAYDAVVVLEAPNDETMSAFILKIGSLGNVKGHTLRAFRRNEMEDILAKIK